MGVSAILGVVLLAIFIPAIRKVTGHGNKEYQRAIIPALRWFFVATIIGLLVCGSIVVVYIVVVYTPAFRIHYHRWQMARAGQQRFSNPDVTPDGLVSYACGDAYQKYEYHREKLVELGDICRRHYKFKHLFVPTPESKHFSTLLLSGPCPNHIDFSSPYPNKPELMQLTVWCYVMDANAWDDFVAKHDVSDYRERFMPTEKEEKGIGDIGKPGRQ